MKRVSEQQVVLEPVAAYNRVAPMFATISERHRLYLNAIDRMVIAAIPAGSESMLDVGSGDGTRAVRIAEAGRVTQLTRLEPSAVMRSTWAAGVHQTWSIRAEELAGQEGSFKVITCLWNVLGHVSPYHVRADVLRQFARLLSPDGLVLIDINHRYNARQYGFLPTAGRWIKDRFLFHEKTGDVNVHWNIGGTAYATRGHVFTHSEIESLCGMAGLSIKKRTAVDYRTGQIRRSCFSGQLFYVLQRSE